MTSSQLSLFDAQAQQAALTAPISVSEIVRKKWEDGEWWYAFMDVVEFLSGSSAPKKYASKLKKQLIADGFQWSTKCRLLTLVASDGKKYRTSCLKTEDILRVIEEIPSPKAEPLKQQIAQMAHERIEEIQNPDLAIQRGYEGYLKKGYSPAFASRRAKSVIHRKALTETWKRHGITTPREFAQLTDRESKGIFGKTTGEMKRDRDLEPSSSLRDEMTLSEITAQDVADTVIAALAEKECSWGYSENAVQVDRGSEVGAKVLADLQKVLEA